MNWLDLLRDAMIDADDDGPVLDSYPKDSGGWGSLDDEPHIAWTEDRVYFAVIYHGGPSIESVPRHPGGGGGVPDAIYAY